MVTDKGAEKVECENNGRRVGGAIKVLGKEKGLKFGFCFSIHITDYVSKIKRILTSFFFKGLRLEMVAR